MKVSKTKFVIILPLLVLSSIGVRIGPANSQAGSQLQYYQHVKRFPASQPDSTFIAFYVSIPYNNLVFVHEKAGYRAGFQLNIFVLDRTDAVVFEKSWQKSISVPNYRKTKNDSASYDLSAGSTFQAGSYQVVMEAIDDNIGHSSFRKFDLLIVDHTGGNIIMGDILNILGHPDLKEANYFDLKLVPKNTNRNDFTLFCEALLLEEVDALDPVAVWFKNGEEVRRDALDFDQYGDKLKLYLAYSVEEVPLGRFTILFSPQEEGEKSQARKITLEIFKEARFIEGPELEDAIEQLHYIGEGAAYDSLRAATSHERRQYWFDRFWQENYPSSDSLQSPIKEEYYRRIRYSDSAFREGDDGWRSDRGQTLVMYGYPDQVQKRSDSRMRNYEIWSYSTLNMEFIFIDEFGTGQFRLIRDYLR